MMPSFQEQNSMAGGMGGGAPVDRDDASSDSSSDTSYDSRLPVTLRRMFSRGAPRLETAEARRRRVQRWWKDRMMSCVIVWVDLFALILLTKGFQAIVCVPHDGQWRLLAEKSILCWTRDHMPMYLAGSSELFWCFFFLTASAIADGMSIARAWACRSEAVILSTNMSVRL